jgi:hypothetical protein
VRRPYEWLRSYYCYRRFTKDRLKQYPIDQYTYGTYDYYLNRILKEYPNGFATEVFERTAPRMDFVGRTENLVDDLVIMLNQFGEPFDEGKLRETPPKNLAGSLPEYSHVTADKSMIARIEEADHKVLETYYANS